MALTKAQQATLKAAIVAEPANAMRNDSEIADWCNALASPAWIVWRSNVTAQEWRAAIVGGGGATQLDALTASKRDSLLWACNDTLDPSNAVVRAALDDFCGSQNTLKAALVAAQKRSATNAEKALSSGTGTTVSPATLGFEGYVSVQDVIDALTQG